MKKLQPKNPEVIWNVLDYLSPTPCLANSETLPQQRVPLPAVSMWAAQAS